MGFKNHIKGPDAYACKKKIRKRVKAFIRHQADRFMRIKRPTWRRPRGIDSRVRRCFRGQLPLVRIGYGTAKKHRYRLPSGFWKYRVQNVRDLNVLMMHNRKYAAEIGHTVSSRKRQRIIDRAIQLNIKILNPDAKMRTEEAE